MILKPVAFLNKIPGSFFVARAMITMQMGLPGGPTTRFRSTPAQDRLFLQIMVNKSKGHLFFNDPAVKGEPLPGGGKPIPAAVIAAILKDVFGGNGNIGDAFRYLQGLVLVDDAGKAILDQKPGDPVKDK